MNLLGFEVGSQAQGRVGKMQDIPTQTQHSFGHWNHQCSHTRSQQHYIHQHTLDLHPHLILDTTRELNQIY